MITLANLVQQVVNPTGRELLKSKDGIKRTNEEKIEIRKTVQNAYSKRQTELRRSLGLTVKEFAAYRINATHARKLTKAQRGLL